MLARTLTRHLLGRSQKAALSSINDPLHLTRLQHTQASETDDTAEFRELVRDFAAREIAPHAAEIDRNNAMPSHKNLWTEMGHMGLHGITVPADYDGLEMGYQQHCIAMEELSRASGSVALSYGAHSNLCINQIVRNGSEAQKQKYLPQLLTGDHIGAAAMSELGATSDMVGDVLQSKTPAFEHHPRQAQGEHIGALAMSEPGAGSDVVGMRCRADYKDGKFVLNGTKMWCTNGTVASTLVVYAKTQPDKGPHGITAFLIEKGMKGFRTAQKLDKLGMRGSDTCELIFENCEVSEENVLGQVDKGVYVLMSGLDYERLVLSAGPLGLMQACLDVVLPYVHDRKQFGQKIGEFQLIQGKLADMYTVTAATRAFVYKTAAEADAGRADRKDCAAVILYAAEHATRMALDAIQILGGNGYINEYPTGRLLRDAKLYEIGAGTSEIRRMLIGRELFKEHAPA